MRRLIPLLVAAAVASCAPAVSAPAPTPGGAVEPAESPFVAPSAPPIATLVASPTATLPRDAIPGLGGPVGSARADFDCDGLPDLLEFFNAPRPGTYVSLEAGKLARLTRGTGVVA